MGHRIYNYCTQCVHYHPRKEIDAVNVRFGKRTRRKTVTMYRYCEILGDELTGLCYFCDDFEGAITREEFEKLDREFYRERV